MSDEFYTRLAATASRLITEKGRSINFVKQSETPADASKPWNGPIASETLLPLRGVFVPPNTVRQFGITALGRGTEFEDMLAKSEQVVITNSGDNDLREYRTLRDGGVDWGIIGLQELKPGNIGLLAFVGVRR